MKFKVVREEKLMDDRHMSPLDNFRWTSGADVQAVWRKHGWTPPSEYRNDYLFMKNREGK